MGTVAGCLWLAAAVGSAQGPSATPHPIPTTPPGAVATRPPGVWVDPPPPPAGCVPETEPNDRLQASPTLAGEFCVSGTLVEDRDQDLVWYEVAPEDGLVTWDVTVRGVPGAYTSIRFYGLTSPVGELPPVLEPGGVVPRVDSDVWIGMPPGAGQVRLAPGPYLLGISRGTPGYAQDLTDDLGYWVEMRRGGTVAPPGDAEPNDDPSSATLVTGQFALSGDLDGSRDVYRWSVSRADAATPWRLTARTSPEARMTLELADAAGTTILEAFATPDGTAVFDDLGLAEGEYLVVVAGGGTGVQPYELGAVPVSDAGVDREPNDTPASALALDQASGATGRLTSDADVDLYLMDVDEALSAGLVDVDLAWGDGSARSLCLATAEGTRIACQDGLGEVALRGLLVPAGRYLVGVSGEGGIDDRYHLAVATSGVSQPAREVEPNDDVARANPVSGEFAVGGDLIGGPDTFAWTIDPADAGKVWHIDASGTPGLGAYVELMDMDGNVLVQTTLGYEGAARIWDLALAPGTYAIGLTSSGGEPTRYVLRTRQETEGDVDPEPNDQVTRSVPLDSATLTARGRLSTRTDVDTYRFDVTEAMAATLTEVTLAWPGTQAEQLCLANEFGSQLQCASGRHGLTLSSLDLPVGPYRLQVSGEAGPGSRYEVRVGPGPARSDDAESEPNDAVERADAWDSGVVMRGTSRDGDVDMYRVHVPPGIPAIWRLEASGTDLGAPDWRQPDGTRVGSVTVSSAATEAVIEDLYLVSGDHLLTIRGGGDYTLSLSQVGPPDLAAEREPNDDADRPGPLRLGAGRTGRLSGGDDTDVFRFSLSATEHVVLTATPAAGGAIELELTSADTSLGRTAPPDDGGATVFDGLLPPADYEVWVRQDPGPDGMAVGDLGYAIRIERGDPFSDPALPRASPLPATLRLVPAVSEVAAYLDDGQRVDAVLSVTSTSSLPLDLALDAVTSDDAWRVDLPATVSVSSGAQVEVPVTVHVPAGAWRDIAVRVTVRARASDGAQGTASADILPTEDAPPVAPEPWWPLPAQLLGGLDVASLALGAATVNGDFNADQAHDGLVIAGTGNTEYFPNGPVVIDVDLAGDEPVPVAGITIDPLGGAGTFGARPRAFELSLSLDGATWTPALAAEMSPQPLEQPFALAAPIAARFARLRIDSSWSGTTGPVDLGEWKVIATPGWVPSSDGFDIAAARFGGHVVSQSPVASYAGEMLSGTSSTIRTLALEPGAIQRFVIGFADDRAAQVTGLRWADPAGSDPAARFTTVEVEAALDTPLGPWHSLGTWHLERATDGTVSPFELPEPAWARFIRLSTPGSPDTFGYWEQPASIGVLERPTDDVYRSIVGQWGQSSPRGIRELLEPRIAEAGVADVDVGDTAEAAAPLDEGASGIGRVARSADVDWYELTIPDDRNTLEVMLRTDLPRAVRMRVYGPDGVELEGVVTPIEDGVHATALVEPGATYRVELEQPVLSVVFTFDTSPSIEPWYPLVRMAIASFADDIRPGLEAVQAFPFEEPNLLQGFSDQAYLVRSALDAWSTQGGSSYLEASIRRAAGELEMRDGTRAVLAVGDAVGGGFAAGLPLDDLGRVRPIIFPVHVGATDDPAVSTHIMQDLATTTGGHYQYATSLAEMERQFDRMATWLRRPATYELSYATSLVEYPPGSIAVVPAEGAQVRIGGVAVALVLDTSGSMLKKLGKSTRIAVAKRSLRQLIEGSLPEDLPVALRTFEPGRRSCGTRLAVPLGPLDRADMVDRIRRLKIDKGTKTPLAAAIAAVAGDIGGVTGPRIVVVVTDGAETCEGDPEAAVRSLVEAGIDTTVNIVGFALDNEELKAKMAAWAAAGGGVFTDAQDQSALSAAIADALRAPFRVFDETGALVGEGIVGSDAITVPMGTYRVEVLTHPEPRVFDGVRIDAGLSVQLEIGGSEP